MLEELFEIYYHSYTHLLGPTIIGALHWNTSNIHPTPLNKEYNSLVAGLFLCVSASL